MNELKKYLGFIVLAVGLVCYSAYYKQKRKSVLCASSRSLLSLLPTLSILRKALDKIAEIKSLLEERRIGEWETFGTS